LIRCLICCHKLYWIHICTLKREDKLIKFEQTDLLSDLEVDKKGCFDTKTVCDFIDNLNDDRKYVRTAIYLHPFLHEHLIKTKLEKKNSVSRQINNCLAKSIFRKLIKIE